MSFASFELIDGNKKSGIVLTADHASRALPERYGSLGLDAAQFDRHIAYDIGVADLTRKLAAKLDAPAVLGGFSRLLIDPNRGEDDPTLIMQLSDGAVIPGNYPMDAQEREKRLNAFYRPYHDQVSGLVDEVREQSGRAPFIVSIHSYTPVWRGKARPWHCGLLWDKDDRALRPLLEMLRAEHLLITGDNEPYDGALRNDAMFKHATSKGYPHILIEVRQDLIADSAGTDQWVARLAPMLTAINQRPEMQEIQFFGSRTDPV
ncbi:N-formylglutamate amidohydrolase [Paenochrobactrum pullorum]|uniref:N-formylglutamate amidohydrolase n=1 Tax=Paenochrobactrum pullorum TaxID=1324351 RepID=UPI0035BBF5C0